MTGLQGRKCRLGILRKIESTADTLQGPSRALHPPTAYKYLKSHLEAQKSCLGQALLLSLCLRCCRTEDAPLQSELGHLEQCVLHRRAVHPRLGRAPECLSQCGLDLLEGLVIVHRACIPADNQDELIVSNVQMTEMRSAKLHRNPTRSSGCCRASLEGPLLTGTSIAEHVVFD